MGLTLGFELSLSGETSEAEVAERFRNLRKRAIDLSFKAVSEVIRLEGDAIVEFRPLHGLAFESLDHVVQLSAHLQRDHLYSDAIGLSLEDECVAIDEHSREYHPIVAPPEINGVAWGFAIQPADGSEPAAFVLSQLRTVPRPTRWWGQCFCKTQYASVHGNDNFIRCHTSLVGLLDAAKEIGFEVEVFDDGGYWDSRDVHALSEAVADMNRVVARFAGAFADAVREAQGTSEAVQGTIFEHPDFERLETEARESDD